MTTKPTLDELFTLSSFLMACPWRAEPPLFPAAPPSPFLTGMGLLGGPILAVPSSILGGQNHSVTLREILHPRVPPFEDDARLTGDRAARIAQLTAWMQRFPAFAWLSRQPAIRAGLDCFGRLQKRRRDNAKFVDDVAVFRYWQLAAWSAAWCDVRSLPAPNAEQRSQAIGAAKKLRTLYRSTSLLSDIPYERHQAFLAVLDFIQGLNDVVRRKRVDAYCTLRHTDRQRWTGLHVDKC